MNHLDPELTLFIALPTLGFYNFTNGSGFSSYKNRDLDHTAKNFSDPDLTLSNQRGVSTGLQRLVNLAL